MLEAGDDEDALDDDDEDDIVYADRPENVDDEEKGVSSLTGATVMIMALATITDR